MRHRQLIVMLGVVTVLAVVLIQVVVSRLRQPAGSIRVERGDLVIGVEVTGTLRAVESSALGPPPIRDVWQFKIAMMAEEGIEVAAGQPILAFDTSELQQRLQTKRADLDAAQTEVEKNKVDLAVSEANDILTLAEAEAGLRKAKLLAGQPSELQASIEVDKARLDLELAELEVELVRLRIDATRRAGAEEAGVLEAILSQVESEVQQIEDGIRRMTRVAPRDGIIIHITNWRNEKRKVGDTCSVRDMILEIPDLRLMEADGEVEETLAGRVREGQKVKLRLDAYPDRNYRGTVRSMSKSVREKSWSNPLKVVNLTLSLDETDPERMRPGMRFRGEVEIERHREATLLPIAAVVLVEGATVANRYGLTGWRQVEIVLGKRNADQVEVLEGLAAGDVVSLERRP